MERHYGRYGPNNIAFYLGTDFSLFLQLGPVDHDHQAAKDHRSYLQRELQLCHLVSSLHFQRAVVKEARPRPQRVTKPVKDQCFPPVVLSLQIKVIKIPVRVVRLCHSSDPIDPHFC